MMCKQVHTDRPPQRVHPERHNSDAETRLPPEKPQDQQHEQENLVRLFPSPVSKFPKISFKNSDKSSVKLHQTAAGLMKVELRRTAQLFR